MSWSMRKSVSPDAAASQLTTALPRRPVSRVEQPIDAHRDAHDTKRAAGSHSRSPRADTGRNHTCGPDAARLRSRSMSHGQSFGREQLESRTATQDRQLPAPQADDGPRAPLAGGALRAAVEPSLLSATKGPQPAGDSAFDGQAEQAADAASSGLSTSTTTTSSASGSSSGPSSSCSSPSAASPAARSGDGPPGIDPASTSAVLVQPTAPDEPAAAETGSRSRSASAPAAAASVLPCSNGGSSPATAAVVPARTEDLAPENTASGPAAAAATAASAEPPLAEVEHVRQPSPHAAPSTAAALQSNVTAEAHGQAASASRNSADIATDRQSAAAAAAAARQKARDQVAEARTLQSTPDAPLVQAASAPRDGAHIVITDRQSATEAAATAQQKASDHVISSGTLQSKPASAAPNAPPAAEAGAKRKRAPIVWSAGLATAASAVLPAAAVPSRAVAALGGARTEPLKKRARGEAAVSVAVAPSGVTGAGTAATAAAAIMLPPHLDGASARTAKSTQLSADSGAAAASQPVGRATRGQASNIAAAPEEHMMLPSAADTAGSSAAAKAADSIKPPRVSALQRLGRTVEAVAHPAEPAAPAIRDASELPQHGLMPATMVRKPFCVALEHMSDGYSKHRSACTSFAVSPTP